MAGPVHEYLDLVVLCEDEMVKVPSYGKPELFQLVGELLYPQISHEYSIFPLSVSLKFYSIFFLQDIYALACMRPGLCLVAGRVPVNDDVIAGPESSFPNPSSVAPVIINWKP